MVVEEIPFYVSALRMKAGELTGIRDLEPDIAARLLPRLIVPPPKERDKPLQQELLSLPDRPTVHGVLSRYWTGRPVLLQPGHLIREIVASPDHWLPSLFSMAREHNVEAIPALTISEAVDHASAVRASIDADAKLQLALIVKSGEIADPDLTYKLLAVIETLKIDPQKCAALADFSDADLYDPELVAPIIRATLEYLQELARWQVIAFQGTGFPENNPASHGGTERVQRSEWLAWRRAVQFDPSTARELLFGDYAADCAKLTFTNGRARAIRHLRYATSDSWFVVRAAEKGRDAKLMQDVCQRIEHSGWFDGREYSFADDQIYRLAHGMRGPGTATDWRALNTCHHITRTVRDLGSVKGVTFASLHQARLDEPQDVLPHLIDNLTKTP